MEILAIDPGTTESAWVLIDSTDCNPDRWAKQSNLTLLDWLRHEASPDLVVIEMIASYGMAVGKEIFTTVLWIGRFYEAVQATGVRVELHERGSVKVHLCRSMKATDANIRQALVDRFAEGVRNHGKGTRAEPGWFYGFAADVWAAYGLAVTVADAINEKATIR